METETTPEPTKNISLPAAIVTGAVIIGLALVMSFGPNSKTKVADDVKPSETPTTVPADIATIRSDDYVRGDVSKAEIAIIEYSDSDCAYCQRFHPTLQQVVDESKGSVAWVYRFFPLRTLHPNAYTESLALKCVADLGGNDAFWNYLDTIINVTLNADEKSNGALTTFATQEGIDAATFKSCLANPATAAAVDAGTAEAQSIGAKGTPYSVIINLKNGKQTVIPGAYPIEEVRDAIDSVK